MPLPIPPATSFLATGMAVNAGVFSDTGLTSGFVAPPKPPAPAPVVFTLSGAGGAGE